MGSQPIDEKTVWEKTTALLGDSRVTWGKHWSFNYRNDPKRLPFVLSRYKFAAKMGSKGRSVLELGCGEGIGAPILAENALHYKGVDFDKPAIQAAKANFTSPKYAFVESDFMKENHGIFDTVVSLDVIEHIYPQYEDDYLKSITDSLSERGMVIIGTPNETASSYASLASQMGHVNLYTGERLKALLERQFHQVFLFGINDEVVHTGFAAMSHYLMCIAFFRK